MDVDDVTRGCIQDVGDPNGCVAGIVEKPMESPPTFMLSSRRCVTIA